MAEPTSTAGKGQRRPNLIWILGDQHRAQALGYRGDPNVYTPNIDSLARNGLRFDRAVAGTPWCCPFRAAMLTGQYPHQCGVTQTPGALDPACPTLTAPFKANGYHTAYVGKWHLAGSNAAHHRVPPTHRGGFDYWLGYENNNNQHEVYVAGGGDETPRRLPGYETDALTDAFLGHLRQHVGPVGAGDGDYRPFFAVLSVQPPHSPYVPPHDAVGGRGRRNPASIQFRPNVPPVPWIRERAALDLDGYYGMIENLDWNVGRIRAELQRLGVDQDTWIVFFSDHGDMLGSHGQWEKSSPWEESIRIPFIVARLGGQERIRTGITDVPLNHVDIAPTTLGLCGIKPPDTMVGRDFSGLCLKPGRPGAGRADDPPLPDSAYLQQIPRKFHPHSVNKPWRGVVTRDGWKLVCQPGHDWLLHNLNDDPYELANLAHDTAFQPQRRRLLERLQRWITETGDTFALPEVELPR